MIETCIVLIPTVYVPAYTYIVCSLVELRGVGELHQKMGEQREELLRKMKVLKTELAGK